MKTIDTHAMSIAHDDSGTAVAMIMTPGSLGVDIADLSSPLCYQLQASEAAIILQDAHSLQPSIKLRNVPLGLLQCAEMSLPLFALNDAGNETLQVIRRVRQEAGALETVGDE